LFGFHAFYIRDKGKLTLDPVDIVWHFTCDDAAPH
jgi:hypothetical protein